MNTKLTNYAMNVYSSPLESGVMNDFMFLFIFLCIYLNFSVIDSV